MHYLKILFIELAKNVLTNDLYTSKVIYF